MKNLTPFLRACFRQASAALLAIPLTLALISNQAVAEDAAPVSPLPSMEKAAWIWGDPTADVCEFRTTVMLNGPPASASILLTADNGYELYVNGALVGFDIGAGAEVWNSLECYDITSRLAQGRNVIGIRAICLGGSRGLVASARVEFAGDKVMEFASDKSWRVTLQGDPEEYSHPEYLESDPWESPAELGPMGMAPWGALAYAGSTGGRRQGALPVSVTLAQPDEEFRWPEAVAFLSDDCSVYTPLRGDAWGVCFRVNNWSRAYTEFDLPCPSKIGRKLCVLRPLAADASPQVLVDAGTGAIGSPSVSYDGTSLLVTMAMGDERFFHIYRVPLDGTPPRRLTDGPFHDIDPAELPDGRIVFTSTRSGTFEEYHNPPSRALFVMQADGSDITPITFTPSFDNEPKVMADGRIVFVRTDNFFDRAKVETQLHAIRPDGTSGVTVMGADVGADYGVRLRAFGYGSPAPLPDGRLACISSRGNFVGLPGAAESTFHRLPDELGDLAPLPDGRLLATVLRPQMTRMVSDVLAVIDPSDERVVAVYQSEEGSLHSPVYLGPTQRPPVLADTVAPGTSGTSSARGWLFCENARFTRKGKADWDQICAIRVLAAKALTTRSSHSHIVHAGHEAIELGTVPLAPDGSFYVEVPADMPLALQAVDAEGRSELNEMSWIYVRPGERRSCVGCHHPQNATPSINSPVPHSTSTAPLKLTGQGAPHRFRGNNAGVTGMMDLQFERFRETASLNLHSSVDPDRTGRQEVDAQIATLHDSDADQRISAARRLALFRDRLAADALARSLRDSNREVRVAAALALAACGTRESVPALINSLNTRDVMLSQAAFVALDNLTGHCGPRAATDPLTPREAVADAWRDWFDSHNWDAIEAELIARLAGDNRALQRRAAVALGHIGGDAARAALRQFVARQKDQNPYPRFENDNRTDSFTYSADSPYNPRTLQEAVRALGHLQDTEALGLLREILTTHIDPTIGNLYLAEAAIDALAWIPGPEADELLISTFGKLRDYIAYVGWYSDHPALYACHASPLHARIIASLDYRGSTGAQTLVAPIIRSLPTDPDRALFPQTDTYELLAGRVIRRSGRGDQLIETCLALLGDPQAELNEELAQAVRGTFAAWAGTPAPDNRAAHVLASVCRDRRYEVRVRAAYEHYRAQPEDAIDRPLGNPSWIPQRHWVLFYLGRALGNLGDPASLEALTASLADELHEARHGRPDPAEPNIHFLQLEYTPCWRAAAAWALGSIGDRRAVPTLLAVLGNLDNAVDTRHAAAEALGRIGDPAALAAIRQLAADYPEVSVRRALLEAATRCEEQGLAAIQP